MQIVGYEPAVDAPATLLVARDGDVERRRLEPGTDLAYTLGERHCVGELADGSHEACDADDAPRCPDHADAWPCARCRGECSLPLPNCREEHVVYLAAFAPATFKVGVTRSGRLDRRLREQGADRGAHLSTVVDGRVARSVEADIAADVGDRVRVAEKIAGLHREVDEAAWTDLLADHDVTETHAFDYGLDLAARPVTETLATGTVRGTRGRVVVLDRDGTTYAVDASDLVGHEVEPGADDRERQASLGSFE